MNPRFDAWSPARVRALTARTALLFVALVPVGCGRLGPEDPVLLELERNARTWTDGRPSAYEFAVQRNCFCATESRGPVRIRVEGDAVTQRVYVDSDEPVPDVLEDLFPSVDGLFDVLRDAVARSAASIDVTYDADTGVPTRFWIDYLEMAVDEELGMEVTEDVSAVD